MSADNEALAFARLHRPNYVTEGVGTEHERTRVKCDGDGCGFYAEHRSWFRALDGHSQHVADWLAARDARIKAEALREAADELAAKGHRSAVTRLRDRATTLTDAPAVGGDDRG